MDRDNRILLRVSFRNCTFYCKTEQLLEEMKVISIKREIWTEEMINKIELPNIFREGGLLVFCKFCKYFFWTHSQVQVWCAKATFWFVTKGWIVDVNLHNSTLTNIQIEAEAFRSSILQYPPRCFLLLFLPSQHKTNKNFMI